ncbi:MAG: protein tyrosine phosphatase family protein [Verrucomicrobiota bacterium]
MTRNLMDAENTHQVFDWLWSSGQLSERDIERLPGLGIEAVINLALPTSPGAVVDEADRVARLGIAYLQIPVVWEDPRPGQFQQFAAMLEAFRSRKVWVHCAKNMRASAFIHLYRRRVLGESEAEAGFPMTEVWIPDATWRRFIDEVMREANPAHGKVPASRSPGSGRQTA